MLPKNIQSNNPNLIVGRMLREEISKDKIFTEEDKKTGKWMIEGIFAQGNVKNNNSRVYPTDILDKSIETFVQERVIPRRALGQLGHPDSPKIDLDKACILVTEMVKKGDDFYGRAEVLHDDCPNGKILRGLIKSDVQLGVSTRGLGSANNGRWQNEDCDMVDSFVLRAVDVVMDNSAPDATINAIREEKQYILDSSNDKVIELNEETYKLFESQISNLSLKQEEKSEKVFNSIVNFLNSLKSNS